MHRSTLIALSLLSAAASAEAVKPRELTLAEALALLEQAPPRRAAVGRVQAAVTALAASGALPPTTLGLGTASATARATVTAAVPIPVFGTLGADRDIARAELGVARAEANGTLLDLQKKVVTAWIELARTGSHVQLTVEIVKAAEELSRVVHERFAAGDAARLELLTIEAAAARAHAEAIAAENALGAASAGLAGAIGVDPLVPLRAAGELPVPSEPPPLASLYPRAPAHPAVRAAGARMDAEGARRKLAAAQRFPELGVNGEFAYSDPTLPGNDFRVGLSLTWPFFGKRALAEEAALGRLRAAAIEQDAALLAQESTLVAAHAKSRATWARSVAFDTQVAPAQEEATRLAGVAFREGETTLMTLLQASRMLIDVRVEAIDARADAAIARAELDWAAGGTP